MDYRTYVAIVRRDMRDGTKTIGLGGDAIRHAARMAAQDPELLEALAARDPMVQRCTLRADVEGDADPDLDL